MATQNLMETQFPENYSRGLYDGYGYDIGPNQTDKIASTYFIGTSRCLKDIKSKEQPVAFVFDMPNGEISAAAIIRYIPNEDENMPGHWNYVWTFYKEDIPEDARLVRLSDVTLHQYFKVTASEFRMGFRDDASCASLGNYLMNQISQWLHDNANADEETCLKLDGIFQARAIVEDNEVVKSLELIGETKAIIKDDAGSEV